MNYLQNWDCTVCTFKNPNDNINCQICLTLKPKNIVWQCANCTFINDNENKICEICEIERNPEAPQLNSIKSLHEDNTYQSLKTAWICNKCTFINSNTKDICEICGILNDLIHKEKKTKNKTNKSL